MNDSKIDGLKFWLEKEVINLKMLYEAMGDDRQFSSLNAFEKILLKIEELEK